jgi:putative peptidoglycan lipid II flippase
MQGSVYKKVGIASAIMMSSVFLSRSIGLFREMVVAYVGGADWQVDAYQIAFVLPEILNHVVATGFLSITFIPIFNKYLEKDMEEEGWRVFSLIFTVFGTLLTVLVVPAWIWADWLVKWAAKGNDDPQLLALAIRMTRIVLPAQLLFFAGGLFMAVQFAKERFLIPALAPLVYNLGIIMGGLLLGPMLGMEGFSWGVLAGALIGNFVLQWIGARRTGMKFTFFFNITHPALKRYFLLTLPLVLGLTMTFSTEVFFRFFGSYMPEGTIAALNYGLRVMLVLVGIFGQAVGTASYPFMAALALEGKLEEMNQLLNRTLKYLILVIPFSVLLMILRHEVVMILFQRGHFDAAATALTSKLLPYLLAGAFAFSIQTVVVRSYYAMEDTLFPAIFCTIAVGLSIPFYLIGMEWLGPQGVALGVSFSSFLQVALLYILWNRRSQNRGSRSVYTHVVKVILLSCFIGAVLEILRNTILPWFDVTTKAGAFLLCVVTGIVFLVILVPAGKLMRINEIQEILIRPIVMIKGRLDQKRGGV